MKATAIVQAWIQGKLHELDDVTPEQRRAIPLIASGEGSDEVYAAAGDEFVLDIKSATNLFRRSFQYSGPGEAGEEKAPSARAGDPIPWVLSTERVDRDGDIIRAQGWDLTNYKHNNILLFGHWSGDPIGNVANCRVDGKRLIGDVVIAADADEVAGRTARLVDAGVLKTGSVGFKPKNVMRVQDDDERNALGLGRWGVVFEKQELLEFSIVSVPSNADALRLAVSAGSIKGEDAEFLTATTDPTERELDKFFRKRCRSFIDMGAAPEPEPRGVLMSTVLENDGQVTVNGVTLSRSGDAFTVASTSGDFPPFTTFPGTVSLPAVLDTRSDDETLQALVRANVEAINRMAASQDALAQAITDLSTNLPGGVRSPQQPGGSEQEGKETGDGDEKSAALTALEAALTDLRGIIGDRTD